MSKIKHTGSGNDSAAAPTHLSTLIMLIRHGETAWNLERRLQGQSDAPLNKTGAMQAQRVGVHVSSLGVQAVYSSDLSRAEDTAAAIARAASLPNVRALAGLRERKLGHHLEGRTLQEARAEFPQAVQALLSGGLSTPIPGGGESTISVCARVADAIEEIAAAHAGERVVIVTHGGVLHNVHMLATGRAAPSGMVNCAINEILVHPGAHNWEILRWGDSSHMHEMEFDQRAFGGDRVSG